MKLQIKKVRENAIVPTFGTSQASGFDLYATNYITLAPGERALIRTGLVFNIPQGYEIQIRPRSGLALKHGITVLNSPGTIDSDYLGEVGVILINHGQNDFFVSEGDRIAQGVLAKVEPPVEFELVDSIDTQSERGAGGFGHTGVS